jgi:hypothetical protein
MMSSDHKMNHDIEPARVASMTMVSSCLAVIPMSPMVSRPTNPPPFPPAACL